MNIRRGMFEASCRPSRPIDYRRKEVIMAKNETTGSKAGKAASKTLRGTGTKADAKTAAGSALTQRPDKGKKK
jgi:hypothetical protein